MTCPKCKGEMVYIDNGPRLQYHYCRSCKDELKNLMTLEKPAGADIYGDPHDIKPLTQEEIDELFNGVI